MNKYKKRSRKGVRPQLYCFKYNWGLSLLYLFALECSADIGCNLLKFLRGEFELGIAEEHILL